MRAHSSKRRVRRGCTHTTSGSGPINILEFPRCDPRATRAGCAAHPNASCVGAYTRTARSARAAQRANFPAEALGDEARLSRQHFHTTYDVDGNLTAEPGAAYQYDAENHMWSSQTSSTVTYFYDGEGRRVKMVSPQVTRRFIYDAAGSLIAEYEGSTLKKEYVYGVTGLLATVEDPGAQTPVVRYSTPDHLGTPRAVSDANGNVSRHDYKPFGEELEAQENRTSTFGYGTDDKVRQKFTGHEHDSATGLYYAQARYLDSAIGRFTSIDPITVTGARQRDPQQLNLYTYVRNNPLVFIDPNGATISFADVRSMEAYNSYVKHLNSDPVKYKAELDTILQLCQSDVNYIIEVGGKQSSEFVEGNTVPDDQGVNILVRIRQVGGPNGEKFERNGRFAHELEHARQFDSGETAFRYDPHTKKWGAVYESRDATDELKAFMAQVRVSAPIKDTNFLKKLRDPRVSDEDRMDAVLNVYTGLKNRTREANNRKDKTKFKPGELVRPTPQNQYYFGRVHSVE